MDHISLQPYSPGHAVGVDRFAETYPWPPYRHVAGLDARRQHALFKLRVQGLAAEGPGAAWVALAAAQVVGLLRIQHLAWDSELLMVSAGRLDAFVWTPSPPERWRAWSGLLELAIEWARQEGLQHVTCRIDAADILGAQALETAGFQLMDGIVTLGCAPGEVVVPTPHDVEIRSGRPEDAVAAASLAQSAFRVDRFHNDPSIPSQNADALYAKWAENSFLGKAAQHTVVAEDHRGMLGFVTCQLRPETVATLGAPLGVIPLVAVDGRARGRGVARRMTGRALEWFRNQRSPLVEVGTQMANVPALRLYQACGFNVISSSLSFRTVQSRGIYTKSKN